MRTLNIKLIGLLLITSLLGAGCSAEDVLQTPGGAGGVTTNILNSGTVSAKNFNLTADNLAPAVYDATTNTVDNSATVTVTASIGDRFNQVLTDSHTIHFKTEYGLIQPYCVTVDGTCSVTWAPSGTLPANDIGGANLGSPATTITAYTYGEEAFTDLNSNGIYDNLDGNFVDLEEPYIDVGNNGIFDLNIDISIDTVNGNDVYGNNLVHDIGDTLFNGPSCTHSTSCGAVKYVAVWDSLVLKLDGGTLAQFSLGGTVTGLTGSVTLTAGTDTLIINTNGTFTFANKIDNASTYSVLVSSQPVGQTCTVTNGTGTVASADVIDVAVNCVPNYTVGGNISGLVGSVTLQNNGGDNLVINNTNGAFSFATAIADGSAYNVTVLTQPAGQTCTPASNSGTIAGAAVNTVAITCVSTPYTVGGTVTGLTGTLTLLENNKAETLPVTTGTFTFTTPFYTTNPYNVTISGQPVGQSCSITGTSGTGTVVNTNITSIAITCIDVSYSIGGAINNLSGSVTLLNNGGDPLIINTAGSSLFTFTQKLVTVATYNVTVSSQPAGQTCTVTSGGSGTVASSNVTSVIIDCVNNPYNISGTLSGLTGSVTLLNNGGDALVLNANGNFTFATQIVNGSTYNVTVSVQPASQVCTVSNGSGTVIGANVTNISVTCATLYTVGGNVSGLAGGSVILQNNAGDNLTMSANGAFTFATGLLDTAAYSVTVLTHPAGQTCTVTSGSGNITAANVTNVSVTCANNTIGGTITGLTGTVTLQNNGGNDLILTAPVASFTFITPVDNGAIYGVTVFSQPVGQTCAVTSGSGTATGPVTNVSVSCI